MGGTTRGEKGPWLLDGSRLQKCRLSVIAAAVFLSTWWGCPQSANACLLTRAEPFTTIPEQERIDCSPPSPIETVQISFSRGRGPVCDCSGICSYSSCDEFGFITFRPEPLTDDLSQRKDMGVQIELTDGSPPDSLFETDIYPVGPDGSFELSWHDGDTDDQEPIDFTVVLYAVDAAGHLSEPSPPIQVFHPGGTKSEPVCTCAILKPIGSAGFMSHLVVYLLGITLLIQRRYRWWNRKSF